MNATPESTRHRTFAAEFGRVVAETRRWDARTPVPEWNAADVVEHLLDWLPGFLASHDGPALSPDDAEQPMAQRWRLRADEVQAVFDDPEVASRSVASGPFAGQSLADVLDRVYTADVFMHTWDLAQAGGIAVELDPDYARRLHEGMAAHEDLIRASGHYGSAVPSESEDPVIRLMAFVGRDPDWEASPVDGGS